MKRISPRFVMKNIVVTLTLFLSLVSTSFAQTTVKQKPESPKLAKKQTKDKYPPGFVTDKCTWFPDGNYEDCCVAHDVDYYKGGKGRRASDKRLYRCVKAKKGKFRASMMYLGVRVFGGSFLPTPFRWGFGKKKMKREKAKVEAAKKKADQSVKDSKKIKTN